MVCPHRQYARLYGLSRELSKVATWLDETVDISFTAKLQTPALYLFDPAVDTIQQLSESNLFTVAKLASGSIFWWGIMPYEHRVKLIEKYQSKAHKLKLTQSNDITVGSYVSLKTFPLYNSGTIAVTIKDGQTKIGQIMEHFLLKIRNCSNLSLKLLTVLRRMINVRLICHHRLYLHWNHRRRLHRLIR